MYEEKCGRAAVHPTADGRVAHPPYMWSDAGHGVLAAAAAPGADPQVDALLSGELGDVIIAEVCTVGLAQIEVEDGALLAGENERDSRRWGD